MTEQQSLDRIRAFWRHSIIEPDIDDAVLVDLMHGNLEFLLRTLVIANLIKSFTNLKLIGIIGSPGVVARSAPIDIEKNRKLGESFGISSFIFVPEHFEATTTESSLISKIDAIAASNHPEVRMPSSVRSEIGQLRMSDRFAIGRVIVETFMRSELHPTVFGGEKLSLWARHIVGFDHWIVNIIREYHIAAFVTGHIDYCPWGHLAERLVRTGGRTVYFRCDARVPINYIDDLDDDETLNGRVRRIEAKAFTDFERASVNKTVLGVPWTKLAKSRFEAVQTGLFRNWRWIVPLQDRESSILFDRPTPTYVVFAHTFTDQPMADNSLFIDHFDWLEATIEHAVKSQAFNLIVKFHPLDRDYDLSRASEYFLSRFSSEQNVRFTRGSLPHSSLIESCAAGITVRGTPGIEMSALGLPMILAGCGPYSDIGFCLQPASQEEYFQLLENGPPFSINMHIQTHRAMLFHAFDRFWSAPSSVATPAFAARSNESVFDVLIEALQSMVIETDPLRIALENSWNTRNAKVLNPDISMLLTR